jgi:hypothetical protein
MNNPMNRTKQKTSFSYCLCSLTSRPHWSLPDVKIMRNQISTIVLVCLALSLQAQMYIPQTNTINTPYGKVTTTSYQYMPMYYGQAGAVSNKYTFTVVLDADSALQSKTRINIKSKKHTIQVKAANGKLSLTPANTREIYRITLSGKKLSGLPADSCWLFKSVTGKINAYSYLAEEGYTYVIAIQDGDDGPILPLTKNNLLAIMDDDPKIFKLIEKKKLLTALEAYNKKASE